MKELYGVTTFSGMGGSALGLKAAGIKEVYFNDLEPHAIETLKKNFPNLPEDCYDNRSIDGYDIDGNKIGEAITGEEILQFTGKKPGEIFVYQSSAPCQDFSTLNANYELKEFSQRNRLFMTCIDQIKVIKPSCVVFENVPSILSHPVFYEILDELDTAGYYVDAWNLNSIHYGSAQFRPRGWIVCYDKKYGVKPSCPKVSVEKYPVVRDFCSDVRDVYYHQFQGRYFSADKYPIFTITKNQNFVFLRDEFYEQWEKVESMKNGLSSFTENDVKVEKSNMDEFIHQEATGRNKNFYQVLAQRYKEAGGDKSVFMSETGRFKKNPYPTFKGANPTLEELKNLSDIPDWFEFPGSSYTKNWNRIGNMVLPSQMSAIMEHIKQELNM